MTLHLTAGVATNAALPLLTKNVAAELASQGGFPLDSQRGVVLSYAVDPTAQPVAGVITAQVPGTFGPFYDGAAAGELDPAGPTHARGLVALFNVYPPKLRIMLTPPPSAPVRDDLFEMPVRAGAVTVSLAVLPAK